MDRKGMQVIKDVASKAAGLVFFSFLAIALGVAFGLMFDRFFVSGQEGVPTAASGVDLPVEEVTLPPEPVSEEPLDTVTTPAPAATAAKYRVKVGPYNSYDEAQSAAEELRGQGYPIYLADKAPYLVQVGAFANRDNALSLQEELVGRGFDVQVQPE